LFPDDVFSTPAEVTGVSDPVFVTGDMGTQIEIEDFASVHSDNMENTDQTQQQLAIDSVTAPVQSSTSNAADDSRMSPEPSTSKNTKSDTVIPGDISESNGEDSVSDSGTVVNGQSKKSSVAEPPNQGLADLQLNQNKSKEPPKAGTPPHITRMAKVITQVCTSHEALGASNPDPPVSEAAASIRGSGGSKVSGITQRRFQLELQKEMLQGQEQLNQEELQLKRSQKDQELLLQKQRQQAAEQELK
jgi:hypothetical protein